jgi:hypothetical protein
LVSRSIKRVSSRSVNLATVAQSRSRHCSVLIRTRRYW